MLKIYDQVNSKETVTTDWMEEEIDKRLYPEKYDIAKEPTFFEEFQRPLLGAGLSGTISYQ